MKKILVFVLVFAVAFSCFVVSASAVETTRTVEYLADGSYYVTEIEESHSLARASKTGTKTSTYYTSDDIKVFSVRLMGTFTYNPGVSATATSETVNVVLHQSSATFVSKSSRHYGATAYGSGIVSYGGLTISKSVNLTCDKYGNLS